MSRPGTPYRPPELVPAAGAVPRHTTAGAVIVHGGRLLLERRPDGARSYPALWDTPGGHVDGGESPEDTLVRELDEELGIVATRFLLGAVADDVDERSQRFYRHFLYLLVGWTGEIVPRERQVLRWFELEEAARLPDLNPVVASALRDFMAKGWLPG